jgi:hypothetical protein
MIILDVETRFPIAKSNEVRDKNLKYADGFQDYLGMGISVCCAYDYGTDQSHVFLKDNLLELKQLIAETNCVIGFNNHKFDDRLLEAHLVQIPKEKSYDLLAEIMICLKTSDYKGLSLGAIAQANGFAGKTGSGADAPKNWQYGKYGDVIRYCLADVALTKKLIDKLIRKDFLINPKNGGKMWVRKPGA